MDRPQLLVQGEWREPEIDKPRTGDLYVCDQGRFGQRAHDEFRDLTRRPARALRHRHGDVGREITVPRVTGPLDMGHGAADLGRQLLTGQRLDGTGYQLCDGVFQEGISIGGRPAILTWRIGAENRPASVQLDRIDVQGPADLSRVGHGLHLP